MMSYGLNKRRSAPIVTASSLPRARKRIVTPSSSSTSKILKPSTPPGIKNPALLVTLHAGDNPQAFVVHKDFVTHYSPVLKAAFNSQFEEGQTQVYRDQDATPRALYLLINWFYTQKLDTSIENVPMNSQEVFSAFSALTELWVLADKLLIPSLQNLAHLEIDRMVNEFNSIPNGNLKYVYRNTPVGSPLRRFYVRLCAGHLVSRQHAASPKRYPQEMLIDLVTILGEAIPRETRKSLRPRNNLSEFMVSED